MPAPKSNMLRMAKELYRSPSGYAIRTLCSLRPSILTKMPEALEDDQRMKIGAVMYPSREL